MSSRFLQFDVQHKDLSKLFTREMITITKLINNSAYPEHKILKINIFDAQIPF